MRRQKQVTEELAKQEANRIAAASKASGLNPTEAEAAAEEQGEDDAQEVTDVHP